MSGTESNSATRSSGSGNQVWKRFRRNRLGLAGAVIVMFLVLVAIFAPYLAPEDPFRQNLRERRAVPSVERPLGADEFGRDILSRLIYGARTSLIVAITSVAVGMLVGGILGSLAGYVGGAVDSAIMRLMDLLLAFPYLLLAIIIVSVLGPGIRNTVLAIGLWSVPAFARVARSAIMQIRQREYVTAALALGAKHERILRVHLLPNFLSTVVVYATLYLAYSVLMEAALSFLGLGVQPPTPSWAGMIASGRDYITSAPHIATIPGVAIALTVLGFNLLGDALRDVLDPSSR